MPSALVAERIREQIRFAEEKRTEEQSAQRKPEDLRARTEGHASDTRDRLYKAEFDRMRDELTRGLPPTGPSLSRFLGSTSFLNPQI